MCIRVAKTESEISACYAVVRELRPHIGKEEFLLRIQNQNRAGYRLAYFENSEAVVAVAGFRVGENLAWGRFLYVDDLVTHPSYRSKGYGAKLLGWLKDEARKEGCAQIHLDSGSQREEAHRFYEREGMSKAGYHFVEAISPNK